MEKAAVRTILNTLSEIEEKDRPLTSSGCLDIEALNKMPIVIEAKIALKELGIKDQSQLMKAGFVAAGLILRF